MQMQGRIQQPFSNLFVAQQAREIKVFMQHGMIQYQDYKGMVMQNSGKNQKYVKINLPAKLDHGLDLSNRAMNPILSIHKKGNTTIGSRQHPRYSLLLHIVQVRQCIDYQLINIMSAPKQIISWN